MLASCNDTKQTLKTSKKNLAYQENWQSLAEHNSKPKWFADAKLGIYFHWGPYAVPAYSSDVRFTRSKDNKSIYVFLLGQPEANSQIKIKHLFKQHQASELTNVSLLNHQAKLNWQLNGNELIIDTPNQEVINEIPQYLKSPLNNLCIVKRENVAFPFFTDLNKKLIKLHWGSINLPQHLCHLIFNPHGSIVTNRSTQ